MNLRHNPKPQPKPAFDRADNAPHQQPPTPEACAADYAAGQQARKNLGKPAQ